MLIPLTHRRTTAMQQRHALAFSLLLLLIAVAPLDAQRRRGRRWVEPIPAWSIDAHIRYSVLLDDAAFFIGGRAGRQLDTTLNVGVGGSLLYSESAETRTEAGFERITSLLYLGPSLELRDSLRGPVRLLYRASVVGGLAGFEREQHGVRSDGRALLAGIEPELGIQFRLARSLQLTMTVGALCAWRLDDGTRILSGPIATTGVRFVR